MNIRFMQACRIFASHWEDYGARHAWLPDQLVESTYIAYVAAHRCTRHSTKPTPQQVVFQRPGLYNNHGSRTSVLDIAPENSELGIQVLMVSPLFLVLRLQDLEVCQQRCHVFCNTLLAYVEI
jgi:hypothetical protein